MELSTAQLRELLCPSLSPSTTTPCGGSVNHGVRIVIADRGHVWVGRVVTDDEWVYVRDASAIRIWGTTKGLGEIAEGGPTAKTVLDKCGEVHIARRALIALSPCKESAWKL